MYIFMFSCKESKIECQFKLIKNKKVFKVRGSGTNNFKREDFIMMVRIMIAIINFIDFNFTTII